MQHTAYRSEPQPGRFSSAGRVGTIQPTLLEERHRGTTPSSTARGRRRPRELRLQPATKNWLLLNDEFLMGPRYVALLEGVDQLGSIRAACGRAGVSYRTAMNRVRQMERVLGTPVLRTRRGGATGGGSTLTAEARAIVRVFREWRTELVKLSDAAFRRAMGRADLTLGGKAVAR